MRPLAVPTPFLVPKLLRAVAMAVVLAVPALASATAAPVADPSNLGEFLRTVVAAAATGQWKVVAGLAIVAAVWAIRAGGARTWPFLASDSGGAWVAFVTGVLGAVGGAPVP